MEVISASEARERMRWTHHTYQNESGLYGGSKCDLCGNEKEFAKHVPYDPKRNRYPMMLHKAYKRDDGRIQYGAPEPDPSFFKEANDYWQAVTRVEKIRQSCQRVVHSDAEYEEVRANGEGWRDTPEEAIAFLKGLEDDIAEAAAHRHYDDRRMSEAAQAEAKAADDATDEHLPVIPEQRRVRRPRKAEPVAS